MDELKYDETVEPIEDILMRIAKTIPQEESNKLPKNLSELHDVGKCLDKISEQAAALATAREENEKLKKQIKELTKWTKEKYMFYNPKRYKPYRQEYYQVFGVLDSLLTKLKTAPAPEPPNAGEGEE